MPEDLQVLEARRDLLAYASFRISPPTVPPSPEDRRKEDALLIALRDGLDTGETPLVIPLEQRFAESLMRSVGIPLEVSIISLRRGSIELGLLILGSYALLKDYKPLRDSLDLLVRDINNVLASAPGGLPPNWNVEVSDFVTPGTTVPGTLRSFVGMGLVSRYALLYLIVINFLVLIFFCYLALAALMANT